MTQATKVQKQVQVLATYKFKHVARICFTVKSSQSDTTYHTCFQGDGRESCDCPAGLKGRKCYHVEQLRERAQAYFQSKQQAEKPVVTSEQIVNVQIGNTTISEPISNLGNAVAHHIWAKRLLAGVQEEPARKAEREARLQREADEMIAEAERKYDTSSEVQAYFLGLCQKQPETKKLSAEEANQFFMEQAEKRNQAPLNGQGGFSLLRV